MNVQTKDITLTGLLIALVAAATMVITIPVPATEGFIHAGDGIIFFAAVFFGKRKGALAAGVGSALADMLLGYTMWILPTLIVKGIMGYLTGLIAEKGSKTKMDIWQIGAVMVGAIWMAGGYLVAGSVLKGSFTVALVGLPWDLVQGVGGVILFLLLAISMRQTKMLNHLSG